MHQTLEKFGAPKTQLMEFRHWTILLRPAQATLGSMVLCSKSDAMALSALTVEAFTELKECITSIEKALAATFEPDKLNYLMLMMVDPHVHFHVLPRYSQPQVFEGVIYEDPGWPGPPNLGHKADLPEAGFEKLKQQLASAF